MAECRTKRIVVADDDAVLAGLLAELLTDEGFEVYKQVHSTKVFDTCKEKRPDLIVLDMMMPYLDGLDIIKLLSWDDDLKNVPILAISAKHGVFGGLRDLKGLRIVDYIYKPFSLDDFVLKINKALAGSHVQNLGGISKPEYIPRLRDLR